MTTETTTLPLLPVPGDIHRAYITWHLIDGNAVDQEHNILIVDAEHTDDGALVTWMTMVGIGADHLPDAQQPRRTTFPRMEWPEGAILWRESVPTRTYRLSLSERVGAYKPRDPAANSIEHLRDAARRGWAAALPDPDRTRKELRELTARLADLPGHRDELIRRALAEGVRVEDIAADADLSPARIYQIRDGRR
jgi:hypothetical protein